MKLKITLRKEMNELHAFELKALKKEKQSMYSAIVMDMQKEENLQIVVNVKTFVEKQVSKIVIMCLLSKNQCLQTFGAQNAHRLNYSYD